MNKRIATILAAALAPLLGCGAVRHPPVQYPTACKGAMACLTLALEKLEEAREIQSRSIEATARVVPPGTIVAYGGVIENVPAGWKPCIGQAVSRSEYASLFTAIGTAWGSGDGVTTFNLPDLQGRFLRGVDGDVGRDPDATSRVAIQNGGNSGARVGSLQSSAFASHDHGGGAHTHSFALSPCTHSDHRYTGVPLSGNHGTGENCSDDRSATLSSGVILSAAGGRETRPVNAAVHYLIKI